MKKSLLSLSLMSFVFFIGYSQCVYTPGPQFSLDPAPDSIPCIESGIAYASTLILRGDSIISSSTVGAIAIDSFKLDSIVGLPAGISYSINTPPTSVWQCISFSGTTTAPPGSYTIDIYVNLLFTIPGLGPISSGSVEITDLCAQFNSIFNDSTRVCPQKPVLKVIVPGSTCPQGVGTLSVRVGPHISSGSPCGGGTVTLDAGVSGGSGINNVSWSGSLAVDSPASELTTVTIPSTGSYTFTVQAIDLVEGDTSTSDITINASAVPYVVDAGNNTNLGCTGGSGAFFDALISTGNGAGSSYRWSNGQMGSGVFVTVGTYTVTATDAGGCLTATDNVTVFGNVDIDFTVQHENCGSNDGSISATVIGGIGPLTYAWSNSGNTSNISGLSAGTYILSVSDTSSCFVVDSVTVQDSCGIISGYVFNDVNGNGVKDGGEQGVAGTEIMAFGGPAACVNSMGYYEMIVPAYGTYTITVDTPYRYYCFNSLYIPDEVTTPANGSYNVTINSGNTIVTGIDFGLKRPVTPCGMVSGFVFEDDNGNGIQEPGELGLSNQAINITPGGFTFTNPAGIYTSDVPYDVQLTISSPSNSNSYFCSGWNSPTQTFPVNPPYYTMTLTQANPVSSGNNFGFGQSTSFDVGAYNLWGYYSTEPCQNFNVWMDWKLFGELTGDCYLKLQFDPDFAGFVTSTPLPDTVGADFIGWYFPAGSSDLYGCYQMEFFMECKVYAGETFSITGFWDCDNPDGCPSNDSITKTVTVGGSQKRTMSDSKNAMYVFHQNDQEKYAINYDDSTFSYVISFQNTTNDTAYNMTIVDTLPQHFQLNTVSYPFSNKVFDFRVKQDNILVWQFDNVNLPPVRDNRLGSIGFVQFNVVMKSGLPPGTLFNNRAAITYNYSNTLITNTAENILGVVGTGTTLQQYSDLTVYPNPNHGWFKVIGHTSKATAWKVELYDLEGRLIIQQLLSEGNELNTSLETGSLSKGLYLLKVQNDFKVATQKIIIQ